MIKSNPLVLVVDDELHMCNALSRILKQEGYTVITASNGKTALQLTKENTPDLILLDLMMPGIDGREVCQTVREFSMTISIVYFTAKIEPDSLTLKELRSEADAYIAKPATSKKILSTVSRVLESSR